MPKKNYVFRKDLEIIKEGAEPRCVTVYGCPECRDIIDENEKVCSSCGAELNRDNEREWHAFYKDVYGEE